MLCVNGPAVAFQKNITQGDTLHFTQGLIDDQQTTTIDLVVFGNNKRTRVYVTQHLLLIVNFTTDTICLFWQFKNSLNGCHLAELIWRCGTGWSKATML